MPNANSVSNAGEKGQVKQAAVQEIPIKRFQMAQVKNDAVPLGNWPVVKGLRPHDREYLIAERAASPASAEEMAVTGVLEVAVPRDLPAIRCGSANRITASGPASDSRGRLI